MIVGEAQCGDLNEIAAIDTKCIECAWTLEMLKDAFLRGDYKFFVCKTDVVIAGYCSVRLVLDEAEICNIAVDEQFRRKGIAMKLLKACEEYCVGRKCSVTFLEVNENNLAALTLYEKSGYKAVGRRENYYKNGAAVIMKKYL